MDHRRSVSSVVAVLCVGLPLFFGAQSSFAAKKASPTKKPTTTKGTSTTAAKAGGAKPAAPTTAPKPVVTIAPKPFQDNNPPEPLVPNKPAAVVDSSVKGAKQLAKGTLEVNGSTAKFEYLVFTGDRYGSVGPCVAVGTAANYSSGPYNICESDTNLAAQAEWRAFHTEFYVSTAGKVAVFMVPSSLGLSAVSFEPSISAKTPAIVNTAAATAIFIPYEFASVTAPVKVIGTVAGAPFALGWLTPQVVRVNTYEREETGALGSIKWTHLVRRQPFWSSPPNGDTPVLADQLNDFIEWVSPLGTRTAYAPQVVEASRCGPVRRTGSNPVYVELGCDLQAGAASADVIVSGKTQQMTVARFPSKAIYGDTAIDAGLGVAELINPPATVTVILKDAAGAQLAKVEAKTNF
jgi:hypothetical protein